MARLLMVLTSHDKLGDTGAPTGYWFEELAAPYYVFKKAGLEITLASPAGGEPPQDPKSQGEDFLTADTRRFIQDPEALAQLRNTVPLAQVKGQEYEALFFPGGHGPMWDLAQDPRVAALVADFLGAGKPVGAVCHGPAALVGAGAALKGRKVTGFTNTEEAAVGLTEVVPFLLEDRLKALGGQFERGEDWGSFVVRDRNLVTGQNPASSAPVAECLLEALGAGRA